MFFTAKRLILTRLSLLLPNFCLTISSQMVVDKIMASMDLDDDSHIDDIAPIFHRMGEISRKSHSGVEVEGVDDVYAKLARCCTPVPGDEIIGFITRGSGISVHRKSCINLHDLEKHQGDRLVSVRWAAGANALFLVNIQVEALDRSRLLLDITRTLSDQHVNILNASVSTAKDRTALSRFTFEMADSSHLDAILASVRGVEGVYDVYRVSNN